MSAAIVPRWEWRTFGDDFGDADDRLGALPPERDEESDEVYLLSLASDASVKIRDGLMDVKQLEHVNDDGLEQWRPIMKAAFPLSTADVPRRDGGARRRRRPPGPRGIPPRRAHRRAGGTKGGVGGCERAQAA